MHDRCRSDRVSRSRESEEDEFRAPKDATRGDAGTAFALEQIEIAKQARAKIAAQLEADGEARIAWLYRNGIE